MDIAEPIPVVDHIATSSGHVSAELRIGDRHERAEVGVSIPGLLIFEQIPDMLACSTSAQNAVMDLINRAHSGEKVRLPVDLSSIIRQANEPWPIPASREDLPASATSASPSVEVTQTMRDVPGPGLTTVHLLVGETPTIVVVDLREGPNRPARFQFVAGAHPWQVLPREGQAMLKGLLDAVKGST
jgi:hypothetical protein